MYNPHFHDAYRMVYGLSKIHREEIDWLKLWWEWMCVDGEPVQVVPMLDMKFKFSDVLVSA